MEPEVEKEDEFLAAATPVGNKKSKKNKKKQAVDDFYDGRIGYFLVLQSYV